MQTHFVRSPCVGICHPQPILSQPNQSHNCFDVSVGDITIYVTDKQIIQLIVSFPFSWICIIPRVCRQAAFVSIIQICIVLQIESGMIT